MNNLDIQVTNLIKKHQEKMPVDIFAIANELGLAVYKANGDTNISGKIVKDERLGGPTGYAIFVNNQDSSKRQRFTIAHEIAHFLLHKTEIGDGIVDDALYRSDLSNKLEAEANKLAAEILMPWSLIDQAMTYHIKNVHDLAKIFHVSESAMSIRLGVPG